MKIIQFYDIVKWVFKQPDDREVNWDQNWNVEGNCGCLMVQYGRAIGLEFESCGISKWHEKFGEESPVAEISDGKAYSNFKAGTTFFYIKNHLKRQGYGIGAD